MWLVMGQRTRFSTKSRIGLAVCKRSGLLSGIEKVHIGKRINLKISGLGVNKGAGGISGLVSGG
jgi:hypothetical protein